MLILENIYPGPACAQPNFKDKKIQEYSREDDAFPHRLTQAIIQKKIWEEMTTT
jgi:hypothetical protein